MTCDLHIGDNLAHLRALQDASIDLVATDPPYFSQKRRRAAASEYSDCWETREEFVGQMRERAVEMHRVLKPTGSLYWQCDPRISHCLQVMLDEVFGVEQWRNSIAWCYHSPGHVKKHYPRKHDVILFYARDKENYFDKESARVPYKSTVKSWEGSNSLGMEGLTKEDIAQRLLIGKVVEDHWLDGVVPIKSITETARYPTQKPIVLYERIIKVSSPLNGLVLDPFCGSGTTGVAALRHGRSFIGMDANPDAIAIAGARLDKERTML